jgi:hypothetical protein
MTASSSRRRTRRSADGPVTRASVIIWRHGRSGRLSFAASVWVTKPDGKRGRKYVYGATREDVHDKWVKLQGQASAGPVATKMQTLGNYLTYWLREVVEPNLSPATGAALQEHDQVRDPDRAAELPAVLEPTV